MKFGTKGKGIFTKRNKKSSEKRPLFDDVMTYIQQDRTLLSDEETARKLSNKINKRRCMKCRKFIYSFNYKGNSVVDIKDGVYVARFDKENMKRFIELQYLVKRKNDGKKVFS